MTLAFCITYADIRGGNYQSSNLVSRNIFAGTTSVSLHTGNQEKRYPQNNRIQSSLCLSYYAYNLRQNVCCEYSKKSIIISLVDIAEHEDIYLFCTSCSACAGMNAHTTSDEEHGWRLPDPYIGIGITGMIFLNQSNKQLIIVQTVYYVLSLTIEKKL